MKYLSYTFNILFIAAACFMTGYSYERSIAPKAPPVVTKAVQKIYAFAYELKDKTHLYFATQKEAPKWEAKNKAQIYRKWKCEKK